MELHKHYKMYKNGKNWCYMALATVVTAVGLAMTPHHSVLADTNTQASVQQDTQDDSNSTTFTIDNGESNQIGQENQASNVANTLNLSSQNIDNDGANDNSSYNEDSNNNWLTESKVATQSVDNNTQNGWVPNDNGQMTYYQNGQVSAGRHYVNLPTIPNTNVSGKTNWYLTDNGVVQSGFQEWQGSHYYFDPQTYLVVKNAYVDPDHNDSGYLLGKDGIALNGIQKWKGTYYAFDHKTYRLVKNQKFQEWGYTYQIDDQGRVVSGLYKDTNGDIYYYSPSSYLVEKNTYVVPAGMQNGYLFGNDGKALTGVQKWQGTYYDFDSATKQLVRNNYVKSQWGMDYMFGDNGMIVTGPHMWQGSMYFFDPTSYLRVDNDYRVPAGSNRGYLLDKDGRALTGVQKWQGTFYYFDPATYLLSGENYVRSQWGSWYMVGSDGRIVSGPYKWQGSMYYFDPVTYQKVINDYRVPAGSRAGYLLGSDGQALTGLQKWQGTTYYFDPTTYQLVTNRTFYANGQYWHADNNGFLSRVAATGNEAFLLSIKQAAIDGWKTYGVLPSVTGAQAIIESGWGRSALATQGHNLFGIKGSYNGQSIVMRTAEYGRGGYYYINAPFRRYPSNYESVVDHGRFLAQNSRYRNLLWDRSYTDVTAKLQRDGYATDPRYASTLNNTIRRYGLDEWDREAFN